MYDESGGRRTSIQNEIFQNFTSAVAGDEPKAARISIIVIKSIKDEKFTLKVMPNEKEIMRTLQEIYTLRANLCVEFPYYYVP